MFDEFVSVRVAPDGIVEERRYVADEETLAAACGMLLSAERRLQRLSARPDIVSDTKVNREWWDSLESMYQRERVVWRLFAGPQPTPEANRLYDKFRRMLLEDSKLEANA
jgi:hypothetical protein